MHKDVEMDTQTAGSVRQRPPGAETQHLLTQSHTEAHRPTLRPRDWGGAGGSPERGDERQTYGETWRSDPWETPRQRNQTSRARELKS